jgi:anti-anti-sigma factor
MDYKTPSMMVRQMDDLTVVRLRGPSLVEAHELDHFIAEIDSLLARGVRRLVVDLKHVHFVGSAALGMLVRIQKHVLAAGGTIVLSHPEHIAELLHVSRMASLFKLAADLKEARTRWCERRKPSARKRAINVWHFRRIAVGQTSEKTAATQEWKINPI